MRKSDVKRTAAVKRETKKESRRRGMENSPNKISNYIVREKQKL